MISRWMLQAMLVSALLTAAGLAAERLLRVWRREARVIWLIVMGASVGIPLLAIAQALGIVPSLGLDTSIAQFRDAPVGMLLPRIEVGSSISTLDLILGAAWTVASLGLTIRFVLAARRLSHRRSVWRSAVVDGQRLLVSRDAGPAVIGFRTPAVVVPEWVLDLDTSLRALVLRHEREHLDRGDPRLLLGAVGIATIAPWNPLAWFQLHRLRCAMELDCDARVLRAHPDARRYGSLLLAVAQRVDRAGLLAAAALTESSSLLARRIAAMRRPLAAFRATQTIVLGAVVILATVAACEMQSPSQPKAKVQPLESVTAKPIFMPENAVYKEFQVERPVTPIPGVSIRYPDALRRAKVEGEVFVSFIVGPDGLADLGSFKIIKSSHPLFAQAVQNALPQMRFNPPLVGGKPVRQLVQQPFTFSISK